LHLSHKVTWLVHARQRHTVRHSRFLPAPQSMPVLRRRQHLTGLPGIIVSIAILATVVLALCGVARAR